MRSRGTRRRVWLKDALYPYVALQYGLEFITWARDWYAEKARLLEAGEELVELEDDEAAGGKAGLGAAG